MPDFSKLLNAPAGEAKKPEPLLAGNYPGVIKSFEMGDNNKNKTAYVRFHLGLTGWPEGQDPQTMPSGEPMDLTKRGQLRKDFYVTEDALWRLDEFLREMGVNLAGRPYAEVLPETVGASVLVEVQQYVNNNTGDIGNQVGNIKAAG